MQTLPNTGQELVLDMLERYPEPHVRPSQSHDEIIYQAGQRSVVLHYASLMERPVRELEAAIRQRRGVGRRRPA
jgi:hypothetical protein